MLHPQRGTIVLSDASRTGSLLTQIVIIALSIPTTTLSPQWICPLRSPTLACDRLVCALTLGPFGFEEQHALSATINAIDNIP